MRLLGGERLSKSVILTVISRDYLGRITHSATSRSELVRGLFNEGRMWLTLASNSTRRHFRYHALSEEQVALVLISRHHAVTAPTKAVPAEWQHTPELSSRHGGVVVAVRIESDTHLLIDRVVPWGISGVTEFPRYSTSEMSINILASSYNREFHRDELKRVRNLLRVWAPAHSEPTTNRGGQP